MTQDLNQPRRCRGCGYIIEHLRAPRCPECGRPFNLSDPATYVRENHAAALGSNARMVALGAVTALLWITVPWSAAGWLHIVPSLWMAVWAGITGFAFVAGWSIAFTTRRAILALSSAAPASTIVAIMAVSERNWPSAIAAIAGPVCAAAAVAALARAK